MVPAEVDEAKCRHYAQFMYRLDRIHFDALYWSLFFVVIGILFVASWIYQSVMKYADNPNQDKAEFRRKLKIAMVYTTILFLVAGVAVVMEVFSLLALQFCDGEDLMSLYWSTWTMLQLGAEIAILGVDLALYHALFDIKHPKWALALGTPVLVVAGFGHVIPILFRKAARKLKRKHEETRMSRRNSKDLMTEKTNTSSAASIKPEVEERSRANSTANGLMGQALAPPLITFEIDVGGNDDVIRKWPSFLRLENGKALIQASIRQDSFDLEAQRPGPSGRTR
ncbi:hypothetical protein PFICI_01185 [Pestalotiopsis fici W106-1]|uniref:Uncharacterized protein n=1 Tax=Pestalotiopsis fici (strain W106-1 / CGMCC3.15140) TaxID=1229662 RepID=W3XPB6_PESFW|nr:uncharacterized protein PFICI_01185 [Pestalotiopsis fici W106-1]ETS87357.1 hypothetical protein PFICI_01185 [Pestalotiopsis fici W106-1]